MTSGLIKSYLSSAMGWPSKLFPKLLCGMLNFSNATLEKVYQTLLWRRFIKRYSGEGLSNATLEKVYQTLLWTSPASLRCGPRARHIYPSLVLVQPRKTRPYITERLLMGRKESNQTKQTKLLWRRFIKRYSGEGLSNATLEKAIGRL